MIERGTRIRRHQVMCQSSQVVILVNESRTFRRAWSAA